MINFNRGGQDAAALLLLPALSNLLFASFSINTPLMRALRLSLLLSCSVESICRARIDDIDHRGRRIRIRNGPINNNPVSCGRIAFDQILRFVDGRKTGTILLDEVGEPIVIDRHAEAYAIELVTEADPAFRDIAWNFDSALRSTQTILALAGHPLEAIDAQNGKVNWPVELRPSDLPRNQAFAAADLEWLLLDELDDDARNDPLANEAGAVVIDIGTGDDRGGRR